MFGNNPIRKIFNNKGDVLAVKSIFKTIQGEGVFVGTPSVFIRLGGCNLQCKFCDTEFEDFTQMKIAEILQQAIALNANKTHNLAVITGGEPFLQNIAPLCENLLRHNFAVQIETNGTIFRPIPPEVCIICSPKNTGRGYGKIRPDLLDRLSAIKFIISASNPLYQDIPAIYTHKQNRQDKRDKHDSQDKEPMQNIDVYLQPMDEYDKAKNQRNVEYTRKLAEQYGCKISIQLHKILGIQ